jgi:hypothetical protein
MNTPPVVPGGSTECPSSQELLVGAAGASQGTLFRMNTRTAAHRSSTIRLLFPQPNNAATVPPPIQTLVNAEEHRARACVGNSGIRACQEPSHTSNTRTGLLNGTNQRVTAPAFCRLFSCITRRARQPNMQPPQGGRRCRNSPSAAQRSWVKDPGIKILARQHIPSAPCMGSRKVTVQNREPTAEGLRENARTVPAR